MRNHQPKTKQTVRIGAFWGSFLLASTVGWTSVGTAIAQPIPNPSLFEKPPFKGEGQNSPTVAPLSDPVPDLQAPPRTPVSAVRPIEGKVNIKLINQTYTTVVYKELSGETAPSNLAGRSTVTLQNLPTPVNLNFYRPDRGFLIVTIQPAATAPNTLELTLTETADQDLGKTSLIVESEGSVYLF